LYYIYPFKKYFFLCVFRHAFGAGKMLLAKLNILTKNNDFSYFVVIQAILIFWGLETIYHYGIAYIIFVCTMTYFNKLWAFLNINILHRYIILYYTHNSLESYNIVKKPTREHRYNVLTFKFDDRWIHFKNFIFKLTSKNTKRFIFIIYNTCVDLKAAV